MSVLDVNKNYDFDKFWEAGLTKKRRLITANLNEHPQVSLDVQGILDVINDEDDFVRH